MEPLFGLKSLPEPMAHKIDSLSYKGCNYSWGDGSVSKGPRYDARCAGVSLTLGRQKQPGFCEFKASLTYIVSSRTVRPCLKNKHKT